MISSVGLINKIKNMELNKITFTNIMLDNLNNSISDNGKVDLEHFINLTNKTYEAINYSHCCKSDSELLPSKEKLNFEDWLKLRKIVRISDDAFKWEGSKYTYYYVNDIYKQYLKN